jgi:DNA-binding transcriptional ArsR family regulator
MYRLLLPFDKYSESKAEPAETELEQRFEALTRAQLRRLWKAKLFKEATLWCLLGEYQTLVVIDGITYIKPLMVSHGELAKQMGISKSTVERWLDALLEAGFITIYPLRQMASPGNSKYAANAYSLEYRRMEGKLSAAIYYEPVVDTANSEPMTQSTEAEIELEVESNPGKMTIGLQVLSIPNGLTSSSTATATSTTSRTPSSYLTTPLVKSDELINTFRDLDRDLFKADAKKSSDHSKAKPASPAQLEVLGKYLGSYERAALKLYEIAKPSELTAEQADGLIKHTQSKNPELTNRLNRLERELRDKAESEDRAREAATQSQRDYEAAQSITAEQVSLYGRELSEAEMKARRQLANACLSKSKAEPALRARGAKLKEVEAATSLTPSERLSNLLELING